MTFLAETIIFGWSCGASFEVRKMSNQYFHYSHKSVVKGGGGGVASLSYISGTDRYANKIDEVVQPPNVFGIDMSADDLMASAEAGARPKRKPSKSAKEQNPEKKRTIARRIVCQLPPAINPKDAQGLLETIQKSLYETTRCPSIGVVHQKWSKERNQMEYHAHIIELAYQTKSPNQKTYNPKDKECSRYMGYDKNNGRKTIKNERKSFENIYNQYLTEKGIAGRVDSRSHAERILSGEILPLPRERVPLSIWHSPLRSKFIDFKKRNPSFRIINTYEAIQFEKNQTIPKINTFQAIVNERKKTNPNTTTIYGLFKHQAETDGFTENFREQFNKLDQKGSISLFSVLNLSAQANRDKLNAHVLRMLSEMRSFVRQKFSILDQKPKQPQIAPTRRPVRDRGQER